MQIEAAPGDLRSCPALLDLAISGRARTEPYGDGGTRLCLGVCRGRLTTDHDWLEADLRTESKLPLANVRFPESSRSECTYWDGAGCPLLAGSRRPLTFLNGDFGPETGRSDDIFRW